MFERKTNYNSKHGQNYLFAASLALRRSPTFYDRLDGCLAFFRQLIYCSTQELISRRFDDHHRHRFQHILLQTGGHYESQGVKTNRATGNYIKNNTN